MKLSNAKPIELLWCGGLLFVLALILYAQSFGHGWTYDDFPVIVDNQDIRSLSGFIENTYPGRPLRELTYLLDHALFGLNPWGYHIQNIFWHGFNAFLVLLLGLRIGLVRHAALAAALLFLTHPLQVEVVANIAHRKDSLALAFGLLACLCWFNLNDASRKRLLWIVLAIVCWLLAYLGKQTAVLIPFVFMAIEWSCFEPSRRVLTKAPKQLAWILGGSVLLMPCYALWQSAHYLTKARDLLAVKANYFGDVSLGFYAKAILKSWGFSASKILWPVSLAPEYTFHLPESWLDPWCLTGLFVLLILMSAFGLLLFRRSRLLIPLLIVMVFFLPVSNLWPMTYLAADRYLYGPMAGISLFLATGLAWLIRSSKAYTLLILILVIPLSMMTWNQDKTWSSPKALWTHALQVSPESSYALNNIGNISFQEGELDAAIGYYLRSTEINPINPTAFFNLGLIYEQQRQMQTAYRYYQRFLEIDHPLWQGEVVRLRKRLGLVPRP